MANKIKALIISVVMLMTVFAPLGSVSAQGTETGALEKVLVIYNMESKIDEGKICYPVHIYAGIDSLEYSEVGFNLVVKNSETEKELSKATTVVYTAMDVTNSNGKVTEYTAEELGGKYMFGQELLFTAGAWFNENTEIVITPYALKLDGTPVDGKKITVTDDKIKKANPNSQLFREMDVDDEEGTLDLIASGSVDVTVANGNKVSDEVTISTNVISAEVPAGVTLADGATELTLTLAAVDESESGVEAGEGEELTSFDVHMDGVSKDNEVPIVVTIDKMTTNGLNIGNLKLYHVEEDGTKQMTQVFSKEELTAHNTYYYNPEDGTISVAIANFSVIAASAETEKGWEGNYDYSWYTEDAKTAKKYVISNADQLAGLSAIVGGMNNQTQDSFKDSTIILTSDINLADTDSENGKVFYPIGYYNSTGSYTKKENVEVTSNVSSFKGTFDGNGHTIKNFYQNTWEMFGDYNDGYSGTPNHYKDAMGLFGYVNGGTVKNLTVDNFSSDGEFTPTGVIAAYAVNSKFENIAITNCNPRVYNTGNGGIVGIGGNSDDPDRYSLTFENITIDNSNKITALWGSWDVACGGLVGMFRGAGHAYMTNCSVAAQIDVYNDVCGNYQYYWYRYAGMMIGTNRNMVTDENGYTVPETTKFHAENCTVHFGDWNNYYYCELVANSLASYTHDHQFSRLEIIDSISDIQSDGAWTRAGNFLVLDKEKDHTGTCYHIVKDANGNFVEHKHADSGYETKDIDGDGVVDSDVLKEDKTVVYLPFNQLFTGYGWGVKHIPVYNGEDYAFDGITILDRVEAESVVKFEAKPITGLIKGVSDGDTVTLASLFKAIDEENINDSGVYVTVDAVEEDSTVSGTFAANATDWTQGTINFSGSGTVKLTIQDYDYCKPTELYLVVSDTDTALIEVKFD